MSLKLKHLLSIFALALGIGTALLISRVKAYAANTDDGETLIEASSNNFKYTATDISTFATVNYVDQYESDGVYYSTMGSTSDIYMNIMVQTRTPVQALYLNGRIIIPITFNVTTSTPTGFTLSNLKYNCTMVNATDDNVRIAFHINGSTNNQYQILIYFDDFATWYTTGYINVTLAFRINALASWSGSTPHRPTDIPINIHPMFGTITDGVVGSSVSFEELRIRDAIDASVDTQGILDQLITANAHMVWSDGSAVYDVADLLWMINGSQMTANSTLQSQYNQDTATQALVSQILSALTTDSSGVSSATNTVVSQAHTLEGTAQQNFDNMLDNLGNDYYAGYQTGITYQTGLDSITTGKTAAISIVADNANSIDFWKRVGDAILDRRQFGSIAGMLMVVLILGFTAWVLKL